MPLPEKRAIVINSIRNADPPVATIVVKEGSLRRGAFIAELGIVENIWDENRYVEGAVARQEAYTVQTRVTEGNFPLLSKDLQGRLLGQAEERLHALKALYKRDKDKDVTLDNLYDDPMDYWTHLGLEKPDPAKDPIREALHHGLKKVPASSLSSSEQP